MIFNAPNLVTLSRIVLIPLIIGIFYLPADMVTLEQQNRAATAVFILAALTDWLDGYLARRRKQVTTLGQLMDPLADKLLITAAFVSLVQMDLAPAWMVAVILCREFAVTVLRSIAHSCGVVIAASPLGKAKMVTQVVAILALILGRDHLGVFFVLGTAALWLAVLTAVASAIDYYRRFSHALTGAPSPRPAGAVERTGTSV